MSVQDADEKDVIDKAAETMTEMQKLQQCQERLAAKATEIPGVKSGSGDTVRLFLTVLSAWDLFVGEQPGSKDERFKDYKHLMATTPTDFPKKIADLALKWRDGEDVKAAYP